MGRLRRVFIPVISGRAVYPTVTITSTEVSPTATSPIPIAFELSEISTDFALADITVTGGTAGNFAGSGTSYTCDVTPSGTAVVAVSVAAGAFHNAAGTGNAASAVFRMGVIVTTVFQASRDTQILSSVATRNYGASTSLLDASTAKMLLGFDVSSVPAGSVCNSATLKLYHATQGAAVAFTLTIKSIASGNGDWPEGTKDSAVGGAGDCCWNDKNQAASPTAWAGAAGLATETTDYESATLGTINGNRSDAAGVEYSTTLTASRVQGWFGVSNTNYGLLITTSSATGGFASKSHATAAYRPTITVNYTINP